MFNSDDKDKQRELFSNEAYVSKKPKRNRLWLGKIAISLSYENIIIVAIGLIMILIVCYSLGVERGKYLAQVAGAGQEWQRRAEEIKDIQPEQEQAQEAPVTESPQPKKEKLKVKRASLEEAPRALPYIQVASFRTDKYAREETEQLRSKGYQAFATRWGKYSVVCVSGYKNKDEAFRDLKQLRKLYADCILHSR